MALKTTLLVLAWLGLTNGYLDSTGHYVFSISSSLQDVKSKVVSSLASALPASAVIDKSNENSFQMPDITSMGAEASKWVSDHGLSTVFPEGLMLPEIDTSVFESTPLPALVHQAMQNPLLIAPVAQVGIVLTAMLFSVLNQNGDNDQSPNMNTSNNNNSNSRRDGDEIYATNGRYNPTDASIYYSARPIVVLIRTLTIAFYATQFLTKIGYDILTNKLKDYERELERANELSGLLTTLGPAFIKIGQSLSVRTDLLRPAYVTGLTQLQDCVPAFSTTQAQSIICSELGISNVQDLFLDLDESTPVVAAASLGQVYKCRLRNPVLFNVNERNNQPEKDTFVAIKVQRPGIVKSISLDLYIIRTLMPIVKQIAGLESDLVSIVDNLGEGFVDELNYLKEGDNSVAFNKAIADTPLAGTVFAPEVYFEYSNTRVLCSKWIDGERLENSLPQEIERMCSIAMNTYLTMMLEMPLLHSDPHPGNLKRTPDGKLCILDWGLITSIPPDLQSTYIEHISHLVSKDYDEVPSDLVALGFISAGMEDKALEQGVVKVLAEVYGKWALGGGAAKVDVANVIGQLQGLTQSYGNLFRLPPYFAYIARAFGTLEGIGLAANPDYSIVNECLPYISQRLLTSGDTSNSRALESFLFGSEKANVQTRVIDVDRIKLLTDGFSSYSISATSNLPSLASVSPGGSHNILAHREESTVDSTSDGGVRTRVVQRVREQSSDRVKEIEKAAELFASILIDTGTSNPDSALLAPTENGYGSGRDIHVGGNPLQDIIITESAKILGAYMRKQFSQLRERSGPGLAPGRSRLGELIDPLGLFTSTKLINKDVNDDRILESTAKLLQLVHGFGSSTQTEEALSTDHPDDDRRRKLALLNDEYWLDDDTLLAPSLSAGVTSTGEVSLAVLSDLSSQELLQVSVILANKLYEKRDELRKVMGKVSRAVLNEARVRLS